MGSKIKGIEGLSPDMIKAEVMNGGSFRMFDYTISIVVMTFRRSSDVYFIRHDGSHWKHSLPFTLISFFLGWWGFPWELIYTPGALGTNLGGGRDVTKELMHSFTDLRWTPEELAQLRGWRK
ncbi:MAG: hypothetical protein KA791_10675 [Flavobacteriales bacterium]|nr:hypothetical protein [Flavobacteriales bacterium]